MQGLQATSVQASDEARRAAAAAKQHEGRSLPLLVGERGIVGTSSQLLATETALKPLEVSFPGGTVLAVESGHAEIFRGGGGAACGDADARQQQPVRWWQDPALTFGDVALPQSSSRWQQHQQQRGG
jgi:hypothetical protein